MKRRLFLVLVVSINGIPHAVLSCAGHIDPANLRPVDKEKDPHNRHPPYPDFYSYTVGGEILDGETPERCAQRLLREQLSISPSQLIANWSVKTSKLDLLPLGQDSLCDEGRLFFVLPTEKTFLTEARMPCHSGGLCLRTDTEIPVSGFTEGSDGGRHHDRFSWDMLRTAFSQTLVPA